MGAEIALEDAFSPKTVEPKPEKVEPEIEGETVIHLGDDKKHPSHRGHHHHPHHRPIIFKEKEFKVRPSLLT